MTENQLKKESRSRKILWIGDYISREIGGEFQSQGEKLLSGFVSTTSIVEGLDENGVDMDTINSYLVLNPEIKSIQRREWTRNGKSVDINVGYKNIKYIQHILRTKALLCETKKWIKNNKNQDVVVLVNNMCAPYLTAAAYAKRSIKGATIALIVPDLPQYMELSPSRVKRVLKKIDWIYIKRKLRSVDKYILYAEPMANFLNLKDDEWIVMEGLAEKSEDYSQYYEETDITTVMYSGVLDMKYGIMELLEAMSILGDSYELWLTGRGDAVEYIEKYSKQHSNIKYYGYFDSREDLLKKQAQATMLISPRRDVEVASSYCFPSKLFEYMMSGRPVISSKLAGIPEEYANYIIMMETVSWSTIVDSIIYVKKMDEKMRKEYGERARDFVIKEKNKTKQTLKIIDFIKG